MESASRHAMRRRGRKRRHEGRGKSECSRKRRKKEDDGNVWKWWKEKKKPDGVKWNFLEHSGPMFAAEYELLPSNVKFYYNGEPVALSEAAEEVATFYAQVMDHKCTTNRVFRRNFMGDWRQTMTSQERALITDLKCCDFREMRAHFLRKCEDRKAMNREEKMAIKEENEVITEFYGFCIVDGHREKIGNFKVEPPGLFRGRGDHPKMGKVKRRIEAEDVIINCSRDSRIPLPPRGHRWKEVRHDNTVTWLASWTDNVLGQVKYVSLNPSSKMKGEKDLEKYETARRLGKCIGIIRRDYIADLESSNMAERQRAVALYFIDKLSLRAGNEKDEDQADTVGCCSLRVEHVRLDIGQNIVLFDFPGKDCIRYCKKVIVDKRVYRNLLLFVQGKEEDDELFDLLTTRILNRHLDDLMEGLTAKVFRTYNASKTLQEKLEDFTDPRASPEELLSAYNEANRCVAVLCNHRRTVQKSHRRSITSLMEKLSCKEADVRRAERNLRDARQRAKCGGARDRLAVVKARNTLERMKCQLRRLESQIDDKEANKSIALGTSKLNYIDPRISVAWCKKNHVPVEKVFSKTQRERFRWAIEMAKANFVF